MSIFGGSPRFLSVTPPDAVGYANGFGQSVVSLARCVGPVIGGYVGYSDSSTTDFRIDILSRLRFGL
jgi:hypothetical protein